MKNSLLHLPKETLKAFRASRSRQFSDFFSSQVPRFEYSPDQFTGWQETRILHCDLRATYNPSESEEVIYFPGEYRLSGRFFHTPQFVHHGFTSDTIEYAVYADAYLLGTTPFATSASGQVIPDSIFRPDFDSKVRITLETFAKGRSPRNRKLNAEGKATHLESAMLLTSLWTSFGHWVPEHLLKLYHLADFEARTGLRPKLILEENYPRWKLEFLRLLGFEESDVYEWKGRNDRVSVGLLVVPKYPEPFPLLLEWLRSSLIHEATSQENKSSDVPFYLSRAKINKRRVTNESEVIALVRNYGYEPINPEQLSIKDQIQIFSTASALLGVHGSAFANLLWGSHPTVSEIFPGVARLGFYRLAKIRGLRYVPLLLDRTPYFSGRFDDGDGDFNISLSDLDRHLGALRSAEMR